MLLLWLLPIAAVSSFAESEFRGGLSGTKISCEASLSSELNLPPNENGLVSADVELNVPNLLVAYERGIFPWGQSGDVTAEWYNPWQRGLLDLSRDAASIHEPGVHIGRSDRAIIRKMEESGEYEVTVDQAFEDVMRECAYQERWTVDKHSGIRYRSQPWVTELFIQRYKELFEAGHAHSVEVWRNGQLVAGLYGVFIKGVFSGESMFHNPIYGKDATKLAFKKLIDRLRANGHTMMDTQQAKGLALKWGAHLVKRPEYMRRLKAAQARNLPF